MVFYNDLAGENYARFIEYALKHSDAVMLVIYRREVRFAEEDTRSDADYLQQHLSADPLKNIEQFYEKTAPHAISLEEMKELTMLFSAPESDDPEVEKQRLLQERRKAKAQAQFIREHALAFYDQLSRFMIKKRHNPIWPVTEMFSNNREHPSDFEIGIFKACEEIKPYLLKPGHLYGWDSQNYPDDIAFFKDHYCWFGLSRHEEYAIVYPNSQAEYDRFIDMGMQIRDPFHPTPKEKLFYEEYPIKS